jgi:hypothetical protein
MRILGKEGLAPAPELSSEDIRALREDRFWLDSAARS